MKFKIFSTIALLLNTIVVAQTKSIINFPSEAVYEEDSDSLKNVTDAVKLVSTVKYFFNTDEKYRLKVLTHEKIKFLTEKGIKNFGTISIDTGYLHKNFDLKVRVIKPDGKFRNFNIGELISENKCNSLGYLNLRTPDIKVNDEIEYLLEERMFYTLGTHKFHLYSNLPTKSSNLIFIINKNYIPEIKFYNGFSKPLIVKDKDDYTITYSWNARNIEGYNNEKNSIPDKTLPFMYFSWSSFFSWNKLLENVFSKKFGEMALNSISKIILKTTGDDGLKDNNSKLNTIVKLHSLINDSVQYAGYSEEKELQGHSLEYFINTKKINFASLKIFYDAMFAYLGIKVEYGAVMNKFNGELDTATVSPQMMAEIFYKFSLDDVEYYLFVKNRFTSFALNEIPITAQGTRAYLYNKSLKATKIIYLPIIDKSYNYKKNKTVVSVKTDENKFQAKSTAVFSGNFSTDTRNVFDYNRFRYSDNYNCFKDFVKQRFDLVSVDSIQLIMENKNVPPYFFSIKYNSHPDSKIIDKNLENIYNVHFKNLISNEVIETDSSERLLDYYFDFMFNDDAKCYLTFDKNVELQNPEQNSFKVSNEFGNYLLSVKQLNSTTILINSTYDINKLQLEKEKSHLIKELYDAYLKALSKNISIKVLN